MTIHKQGLHRKITPSLTRGSKILINGHSLINACSNDYLGIAPSVGSQRTGKMQSSSRLLSGSDEAIHKLESIIVKTKPFEASLVFPTGYMANIGAVTALASKGDCILSDSLNHASIIDACRLSGAKTTVYEHNNMDCLIFLRVVESLIAFCPYAENQLMVRFQDSHLSRRLSGNVR